VVEFVGLASQAPESLRWTVRGHPRVVQKSTPCIEIGKEYNIGVLRNIFGKNKLYVYLVGRR
jgi:hypothetical protein